MQLWKHSTLSSVPPPPTTSLRAHYFFFTFFTNKTSSISSQFSAPHMQELKQPHLLLKLPSLPSVLSLRQKYPNVSSPATLQHALLIQSLTPSPSYLSLPALTHIIITSLLTGTFPNAFKQARVTPLLTKPTLNTSLTDSYRPVSLIPFIAKMLERVVFNQLSSFLSEHNLLDANQPGFRRRHSTETTLSHWSPANCKSWFQIISSHSAGSICCFWHC